MARIRTTAPRAAQNGHAADSRAVIARLEAAEAALAARTTQLAQAHALLQLLTAAPHDPQAVLDRIAAQADELFGGAFAFISLQEGSQLRCVADTCSWGLAVGTACVCPDSAPCPSRLSVMERRTINIPDFQTVPAGTYSSWQSETHRIRALLAVPLLRDGNALGQMTVFRDVEGPAFTEAQVSALESFARQSLSALESARAVQMLQERLAQRTAAADILRVISASPGDPSAAFAAIVEQAYRACDALEVSLWQLVDDTLVGRAAYTAAGLATDTLDRPPLTRATIPGRAAIDKRPIMVGVLRAPRRVGNDPFDAEWIARGPLARGNESYFAFPFMRDGEPLGVIAVGTQDRRVGFPGHMAQLVETLGSQAAIALETARLFNEVENANRTLQESLEQQTATAEVLRVIASSPANLQVVLDAIAASAARLCATDSIAIFRTAGDTLKTVALNGASMPPSASTGVPLTRGVAVSRAVLERRTIRHDDVLAVLDEYPDNAENYRRQNMRSLLIVPLVRDGIAIGAISARRYEVQPFTEGQAALLESFADQAVIAIENARLFSELRERDERRRQELERASAIQQRLLPERVEGWPGVMEVAVRFRPAVETSGDFYDLVSLAPSRSGALPPLQIAVGDVAGKGMSAALVTALARSALRSSGSMPTAAVSPSGTLRVAGQRLHDDVGGGHFVACALAVVEPPGRHNRGPHLRLANAAQVPVLLVRGGAAREIEPPGYRLPLGAEDDGAYRDAEAELHSGDVVVFSSDGLVEAPSLPSLAAPAHLSPPDSPGDLFGFARLAASAAHWSAHAPTAEAVAQGIWSDLTAWCGDDAHHDDMTLLVLRVP